MLLNTFVLHQSLSQSDYILDTFFISYTIHIYNVWVQVGNANVIVIYKRFGTKSLLEWITSILAPLGDLMKKGGYIFATRRYSNPQFGLSHKIERNWELDLDNALICYTSHQACMQLTERDKSTCLCWQPLSFFSFWVNDCVRYL